MQSQKEIAVYPTLEAAQEAVKGSHARITCTCGVTLSNCRCMSPDKITVAVKGGCDTCKIEVIKGQR